MIIHEVDNKKCPHFHSGWKEEPVGVVIHYTASGESTADITWFRNPASKASCHYYIDRKGNITEIVSPKNRSWHAGVSSWNEKSGCNNFMFGIELDNLGKKEDYPKEQLDFLIDLLNFLFEKYSSLDGSCIVGHSHISPGRKIDPGPKFPWEIVNQFKSKNSVLLNKSIQSHIERMGHEIGHIDGILGPKSEAAIKAILNGTTRPKDNFELLCLLRSLHNG